MPGGRKVTAARRQASRLAGLAGGDPLHLTPRHRARGCSGDMQLGQGFTAVARQVPRLAGLVRLPAGWQVHTAIRRQASWLATKASVKSKSRWPFCAAKIPKLHRSISTRKWDACPPPTADKRISPFIHAAKSPNPHRNIPPRKGCVCPTPTAPEQSGDRQRREKGPPILTAEKGEHERAPPVCESWPTPLRATLRAPPAKWAIKAFFRRVSAASRGRGQPRRGYRRPKPTARSDVGRLRSRRAARFLWYFLSLRKKVLPPSGRQPHHPRRSRRVNPPAGKPYHEAIRSFSCARPPRGGSPTPAP